MTSPSAERSDHRSAVSAPARAMPAWIYNHPEMTRLEIERILLPSWQMLCHVSQLRQAGDYVTLDIGSESVVGLRDREGVIRAFHNVCRHRGSRLLDGDGNCAGPITCPYHGWSYRHDGALLGVAARDTFPGLDRSQYGLRPVKVDVAFGFVFIALAGDPQPVSRMWGTLADEFAPYRFKDMVPLSPITTETWNVDWKIAMDNYLESYHVPIGHPGLNRMFTPDYEDQAGVPGVARGVSWFREQPSPRWAERKYQQLVGQVTAHLPEANRRCWRFYSMLPNLGLDVFPEQMDFFQVLPAGPGKCTIRERNLRFAGLQSRDEGRALPGPENQPAGQRRGRVAVRARAAWTGFEQLHAGSVVGIRRMDARVPRPAARTHPGDSAVAGAGTVRVNSTAHQYSASSSMRRNADTAGDGVTLVSAR